MTQRGTAYPEARVALGATLWQALQEPAALARVGGVRRPFDTDLLDRLAGRVVRLGMETEIPAGVRFAPAPGHCAGHSASEVATGKAPPLLHLGDGLLQPSRIEEPGMLLGGNADEDQATDSRCRLIGRALGEDALVLDSPFPWPGIGRVRRRAGRPVWVPSDKPRRHPRRQAGAPEGCADSYGAGPILQVGLTNRPATPSARPAGKARGRLGGDPARWTGRRESSGGGVRGRKAGATRGGQREGEHLVPWG